RGRKGARKLSHNGRRSRFAKSHRRVDRASSRTAAARSGNAGVACARQSRSAVFFRADSHRSQPQRRDRRRSQSVLSDLRTLGAAHALGRDRYPRLVCFGSLSKRSNAPGLRSGYVAGDAALIKAFLLYRTYHGSAMSPAVAAASIAAWSDEAHVRANRMLYAEKFAKLAPIVSSALPCAMPDAAFYLWAA